MVPASSSAFALAISSAVTGRYGDIDGVWIDPVTAQEMIPEAVGQDEPAGVISVVLGFALMMALDIAL